MLEPEVESRPWQEQLALDDAVYREQLAYLFERSGFYREKLGEAGVCSPKEAGGLAEIGALPLTDKAELRAGVTAENAIGAHLCATPDEIVRIYSTSGTTGMPSYIPLTAGDLENWITARHAATPPPASPGASGSSPPTTPARLSPERRSHRSSASASATSRSAPATPSGWYSRSSGFGRRRRC